MPGRVHYRSIPWPTGAAAAARVGTEHEPITIPMSTPDATRSSIPESLTPEQSLLLEGRLARPFSVLGLHRHRDRERVCARLPGAAQARVVETGAPLERIGDTDLFCWEGPAGATPRPYRLHWRDGSGASHEAWDPYAFNPEIPEEDLARFVTGRHLHAYRILGAHPATVAGIAGVRFAVWAPNAGRVSLVGDLNHWDGRWHAMELRRGTGIWELFVPDVAPGARYKFELCNAASGDVLVRSDPCGRRLDPAMANAAVVSPPSAYRWGDEAWLEARRTWDWLHAPLSIYEVHLGSWRRQGERAMTYAELAVDLVAHVHEMGFTHIEILAPGQPTGESWSCRDPAYFAPADHLGEPDDFRRLVDACHQRGIGVLLDWTPAHFSVDGTLACFDGAAAYEPAGEGASAGPPARRFDFARPEVRSFLVSSAVHWIEEYHLDGLRVDAVTAMLYRRHANGADWSPEKDGGDEDLEAAGLLREINEATQGRHPGVIVVAEETSAWPQVTRPPWAGGLGFSMKWNVGWMHDTLEYVSQSPGHRHAHHDLLTLGLLYAFTENFVLPFSHRESTGSEGALLARMPGGPRQRFANLRLLYTYTWTHPGKKLLFMGNELAPPQPWHPEGTLPWALAGEPAHAGMQALVRDLNRLHASVPALHAHDFDHAGFEWLDCHDAARSVLSYIRRSGDDLVVVVLNFSDQVIPAHRIGVPVRGRWREILNSDSEYYGGTNVGSGGNLVAKPTPWTGRPHSLDITLPPLAGVVLRPGGRDADA